MGTDDKQNKRERRGGELQLEGESDKIDPSSTEGNQRLLRPRLLRKSQNGRKRQCVAVLVHVRYSIAGLSLFINLILVKSLSEER